MTKAIVVDANVVIRLLLNDHPRLSPLAKSIFLKAQKGVTKIYFDEVIVAEVIWTLSSFYKIKKIDLVDRLEKLISQSWAVNPKKNLILQALNLYNSFNLHYIDCWILMVSKSLNMPLRTFDKSLEKTK